MDGLITLLVMGYLIPLVGVPILFVKFSDQKGKLEELARTVLALQKSLKQWETGRREAPAAATETDVPRAETETFPSPTANEMFTPPISPPASGDAGEARRETPPQQEISQDLPVVFDDGGAVSLDNEGASSDEQPGNSFTFTPADMPFPMASDDSVTPAIPAAKPAAEFSGPAPYPQSPMTPTACDTPSERKSETLFPSSPVRKDEAGGILPVAANVPEEPHATASGSNDALLPAAAATDEVRQSILSTPAASKTAPEQPVYESRPAPLERRIRRRTPSRVPGALSTLWDWFKTNPLLYTGLCIFLLGIVFALNYMAVQGWFTLEMRLAATGAVGLGMLGLGWRLRVRNRLYGLSCIGGGAIVLYLVLLAAAKLHVVALTPALAAMLALVLSVSLLALAANSQMLAVLATAGGFLAPVLLSSGSSNYLGLFSVYAILSAGNLFLLFFRAWDIPALASFLAVYGIGGAWGVRSYQPDMLLPVEVFLLLFFLLFTLMNLRLARHADRSARSAPEKETPHLRRLHGSLLFGLPLATFSYQYLLVQPYPYMAALSALGLACWYVGLGFLTRSGNGPGTRLLGDMQPIIALGFAALAVPLALNASWTACTWALQGAGAVWLGLRQQRPMTRCGGYLLQAAAAWSLLTDKGGLPSAVFMPLHEGPASPAGLFMGGLMLTLAGLAVLRLLHSHREQLAGKERRAPDILEVWIMVWWLFSGWQLIVPHVIPAYSAQNILVIFTALSALIWIVAGLRLQRPVPRCGGYLTLLLAGLALLQAYILDPVPSPDVALSPQAWMSLSGLVLTLSGLALLRIFRKHQNQLTETEHRGTACLEAGIMLLWLFTGWQQILLHAVPLGLENAAMLIFTAASSLIWIVAGLRLQRPVPRCGGYLVLSAAALFLAQEMAGLSLSVDNGAFRGFPEYFADCLALALAGLTLLGLFRKYRRQFTSLERKGLVVAETWSMVWWLLACWQPIRHYFAPGQPSYNAMMIAAAASCLIWFLAGLRLHWKHFLLPVQGLWPCFLISQWPFFREWLLFLQGHPPFSGDLHDFARTAHIYHPLSDGGILCFSAVCAALLYGIRHTKRHWRSEYLCLTLNTLLLFLFFLAATQTTWLLIAAGVPGNWICLALALLAAGTLLSLCRSPSTLALRFSGGRGFPFPSPDACATCFLALSGFGLALWLSSLFVRLCFFAGSAAPLPYLPLLGPLDLAQGLCLLSVTIWLRAASRYSWMPAPLADPSNRISLLGGAAFALCTIVAGRAVSLYIDCPYQIHVLLAQSVYQMILSVLWGSIALLLMLLASRRIRRRRTWFAGVALLLLTLGKLLLFDLADRGTVYRIVSFLFMGLLMLGMGYFCPLPPKEQATPSKEPEQ